MTTIKLIVLVGIPIIRVLRAVVFKVSISTCKRI